MEGTNDLVIDVRGLPCRSKSCDCNNQRFVGVCTEKETCEAKLRESCDPPGLIRECEDPYSKCKGQQLCQPSYLVLQVWGNCVCGGIKEPPGEAIDGGEGQSGFDKRPSELPEGSPETIADQCQKTELCDDGIDNNCDGQIDEGCKSCLPSSVYTALTGHTTAMVWVQFANNGKLLWSASNDGTLQIRTEEGRFVRAFKGTQIAAVALHPMGEQFVIARTNGSLEKWNATTGQQLQVIAPSTEAFTALQISPDGQFLFAAHAKTWDISIFNFATGALLGTMAAGVVTRIAGKTCADCAPQGQCYQAECWQFDAQKGHAFAPTQLLLSPDGKYLVAAGASTTIAVWDVATRKLVRSLSGHSPEVQQLAFRYQNLNGAPLHWLFSASASDPTNLIAWDIETGQNVTLPAAVGHPQTIATIAFSNKTNLLATGSHDNTIRLWDGAKLQLVHTLKSHNAKLSQLAFHPAQPILVSADLDGVMQWWDSTQGTAQQRFVGPRDKLLGLVSYPSQPIAATASQDGTAILWEFFYGSQFGILRGHTSAITGLSLRPDGRRIATSSQDTSLRIWDANTSQQIHQWLPYPQGATALPVEDVAYSPDGTTLASIAHGEAGTRIWKEDGTAVKTLVQTQIPITRRYAVRYHAKGEYLAVMASRETPAQTIVELWSMPGGTLLGTLTLSNDTNAIRHAMAFHPILPILATSNGQQTQLWDLRSRQILQPLPNASNAVAWSPRGDRLALAQANGIALWEWQTQTLAARILPPAKVMALAFSHDNAQLLATMENQQTWVWSCSCNTPTQVGSCYGGPAASLGKGSCRVGRWQCTQDGLRTPCQGAIYPTPEQPDGLDNDCDGIPDNGFVDLVLAELSASVKQAIPGQTIFVDLCVANQGHLQSRTGAVQVRLYDAAGVVPVVTDPPLTGGSTSDIIFASIAGGAKECKNISLTLPTTLTKGPHTIGAIVDFGEKISELNESNNTRSFRIDIE